LCLPHAGYEARGRPVGQRAGSAYAFEVGELTDELGEFVGQGSASDAHGSRDTADRAIRATLETWPSGSQPERRADSRKRLMTTSRRDCSRGRAQPSPSASAPAAPRPSRAKSSTKRPSGAIYRVARRWAEPSSPEPSATNSRQSRSQPRRISDRASRTRRSTKPLNDRGMFKDRVVRIANSPGASSRGGKKSGSGSSPNHPARDRRSWRTPRDHR
jgi:hypothetical protein